MKNFSIFWSIEFAQRSKDCDTPFQTLQDCSILMFKLPDECGTMARPNLSVLYEEFP